MATQQQLAAAKQAAAALSEAWTGQVNLTEADLRAFKDILIKLLPTIWPIILQILVSLLEPPTPAPMPPS